MLSYVQTIPNKQNYKSDQITMKTIKNVELLPKPFETQQNYKSAQITMNCIELMSVR